MSNEAGIASRWSFSKRSRVATVILIVAAMVGTALTLGFTSPEVAAAPLADVADGTVCYGLDEGSGNIGDAQAIHEVTMTAGNPPVATKTSVVSVLDNGNIESIALRNDEAEIYVYDPATDTMSTVNPSTGALTTPPAEFNLTGLGDIDAMFFQYDADGVPANDILWTVLDVNDADATTEDADLLTGYRPDGTVVAGPIAIDFPGSDLTATTEGATWIPDGAGGGEFFITYVQTAVGAVSTLASLGTGTVPDGANVAVVGPLREDVEGLGTDGDTQMFLTTGEDPFNPLAVPPIPAGPDINTLFHVDHDAGAATTELLEMSPGAPVGNDLDFESIDCAYADITLTKVATNPPVRLANGNTALSYTFTITNTGVLPLDNVTLTDPMSNFTVVSGPTPGLAPVPLTDCSTTAFTGTASLEIDASCTAVWTYEVSDLPGDYLNTASVTGTPPNNVGDPVDDTDQETVIIPDAADPSLAIIKSVRSTAAGCPATYAAAAADDGLGTRLQAATGTTVVYCLNVINLGPGIANSVVVTDSFSPNSPYNIGTLAANEERVFTYSHTVGTNDETNTATVTGTDQDGTTTPPDSDDAGTTDPTLPPDLEIRKTVVAAGAACPANFAAAVDGFGTALPVVSGATVTYCINVINNGPGTAFSVSVSDNLDAASPRALGTIPANGEASYSYPVTTTDGDQTNTATVTGQDGDGAATPPDTDDAGTTPLDPDLEIRKTVVAAGAACPTDFAAAVDGFGTALPVVSGATVTYCINVINNGPGTAFNVSVSDNLDAASPRALGTIPANGETSYSYPVTTPNGDQTNTATVTGEDGNGGTTPPDTDDAGTTPLNPDLEIRKTAVNPGDACPATFALATDGFGSALAIAEGDPVKYCINVINNGPGTAFNVSVSDILDPASPRALGTIAANGEASYDYTINVGTNPETNTANVTGEDGNGETVPGDSDDAGTAEPIVEPASISNFVFEDTDGDGIQDTGEPGVPGVTVRLWSNSGGSPGSIIATDTTDANGEYLFDNLAPGDYFVQFLAPTGRTITSANQGADDALDSDADPGTGVTSIINLSPGEDDITVDAGLLPLELGSISNFVFQDDDQDGIQDTGEPGVPGVTVRLWSNSGGSPGSIIATDTTDANGEYLFDNLDAGDYFVQFLAPTGRTLTAANQGGDDALDSDANPADGVTAIINLSQGEDDITVDAGLLPVELGSISNFVFEDTNQDGIQDTGEPGVPGVTVELWNDNGGAPGSVIATDVTDGNGEYLFDNLPAGNYFVRFVAPTGRTITSQDQGADDAADSDPDPGTGITSIINLSSGEDDITVDAGLLPLIVGSISNFVFEDTDQDGIQDMGEPGVPGVTVNLWSNNGGAPGSVIATDTTDGNGEYLFSGLAAGDYFVQFVAPTGRTLTAANQGGDDATDSDADPGTGVTSIINLSAGENDITVDAGLLPLMGASISNFVFEDTDSDGIQDTGEPGVPGVTVLLLSNNGGVPGSVIATDTTDANGEYLFAGLAPGDYFVQFVAPTGRTITTANQGGDDATDSDADPGTGVTGLYTLADGDNNTTVDAGLLPIVGASISNFVFEDLDADGIQDMGEPGVPGVTVNLWSNSGGSPGSIIATDTTDTTGQYLFANLSGGDYFVQFVAPTGRTITAANQGADDTLDSDPDPATGVTALITLADDEDNITVDAGLLIDDPGSISNLVFEDTNQDGIQDMGEPGVPGVTVRLWSNNGGEPGVIIATDVTDGNGEYLFDNLGAGDYFVEFVTPSGRTLTALDQGGDEATDSDADPATGVTALISLGQGEDNIDVDAGLLPLDARIGNFVWIDTNLNGQQDPGEPGVAGVAVNVWPTDAMGNLTGSATMVTTDANGEWTLDVAPGMYRVNVIIPTGATGFTVKDTGPDATDSDIAPAGDPAFGFSDVYTVNPGDTNLTIDAGVIFPAEIGDTVWLDTNGNGIQDTGEPGVEGVTVQLIDSGGNVVGTETTDADGNYLFDNLAPGTYTLNFINTVVTDADWTTQDQGGDDGTDSDVDSSGATAPITVGAGVSDLSIDAGLVPPAEDGSISDTVFLDVDRDGVQDTGEPGVDGVTVNLLDDAGNQIATTTTDANGNYSFTGLPAGDYIVEFVAPTGSTFVPADQGGDDATDSDANPADGRTGIITLAAGEDNDTVDAGINPPPGSSISDTVFEDTDRDGVQDAGEPGVGGVTVNLLDSAGNQIATTTTDANGNYAFTGLPAGDYIVEFVAPTGSTFVPADQGGDDATDSDANPADGRTGIITLGDDEVNDTVDAGLNPPPNASISDTVFTDTDGDGVQDPGEPGAPGVTVNLLDDSGNQIATTTTDANGNYSFNDLPGGNYVVEFVAPTGSTFVPANQGGDDDTDSDADPATGQTGVIVLADGETNDSVDAGLNPPPGASISDIVFDDANGNGIQDNGEAGVAGVTVRLWDNDGGSPGSIIDTATTDANGRYLFDGLSAGTYFVQFVAPDGSVLSPQDQGGDDDVDSDADPATGVTGAIVLGANEANTSVDAGVQPAPNPVIGLAKRVTAGPTAVAAGHSITYTFEIANLGNVDLSGIVLADDFAATFPSPASVVSGPTPAGGTCSAAVAAAPGHSLAVGESCTAVWTVVVANMTAGTVYNNTATVTGNPPTGDPVSDVSDDGSDVDANDNGNPGDAGESDPTPVSIPVPPATGCRTNAGTVVANQSACPAALPYSGPFNNAPAAPVSTPAPAAPAQAEPLAFTGTSSGLLATLALAMMGAGGALMIGARRRRDEY